MTIRNKTQLSDRRRRVFSDDRSEARPKPAARKRGPAVARRYPPYEKLVAELPGASCLIPIRPFAVLMACLLLANIIAAHAALAAFHLWSSQVLGVALQPLNLTFERNLATTTIGLLGILSCVYAAIILNLRKHRVDDYRGRYRVWYPVTLTMFLVGLGVLTGIGASGLELVGATREHVGLPPSPIWGLCFCGLVLLALTRLLFEVQSSRGTVVSIGGAVTSLLLAGLIHYDLLAIRSAELAIAAAVLLVMASSGLFSIALVIYARHILLEAQGLAIKPKTEAKATSKETVSNDRSRWNILRLPKLSFGWRKADTAKETEFSPPNTKPSKRRGAKGAAETTESAGGEPKTTSRNETADRPAPPPASAKTKKKARNVSVEDENSDTDSSEHELAGQSTKLSRAERKRLRREKKKQRRAA